MDPDGLRGLHRACVHARESRVYGLERLRKSATTLSIAELNAELKQQITTTRKNNVGKNPATRAAAKKSVLKKKSVVKKATTKPAATKKNVSSKKPAATKNRSK